MPQFYLNCYNHLPKGFFLITKIIKLNKHNFFIEFITDPVKFVHNNGLCQFWISGTSQTGDFNSQPSAGVLLSISRSPSGSCTSQEKTVHTEVSGLPGVSSKNTLGSCPKYPLPMYTGILIFIGYPTANPPFNNLLNDSEFSNALCCQCNMNFL